MFDFIAGLAVGLVFGIFLCAALVNRTLDEDKAEIREFSYRKGFAEGVLAGKREIVEAMEKKYCVGSTDVDSEEKSDA